MRDELVAAGLDGARVEVVPPFVRPLPEASADGPRCVLFAGRLVEAKGVRDAIEAWRLSGLDVPLVAAGAGPLRPELEAAGAEVTGWVDRVRLAALLARAGALVLPSRWQEPFGIVGLEALTCGVPVAAWASGGVAEWHPGPGLAPWGDTEALGRALRAAFGTRVDAPAGFEPGPLMARLHGVYESAGAFDMTTDPIHASGCGARCGTRPSRARRFPARTFPDRLARHQTLLATDLPPGLYHALMDLNFRRLGDARVPAGLRRLHRLPPDPRARAGLPAVARAAALPRAQRGRGQRRRASRCLTGREAGSVPPLPGRDATTARWTARRASWSASSTAAALARSRSATASGAGWSPSASRTWSRRRCPRSTATSTPSCPPAAWAC